jgi:hypothetical protein
MFKHDAETNSPPWTSSTGEATQPDPAHKCFRSPRHQHLIIQRLLPPSTPLVRNCIGRWQSTSEADILRRRVRAPIQVLRHCKAGELVLHNVCQRGIDGHAEIKRRCISVKVQ